MTLVALLLLDRDIHGPIVTRPWPNMSSLDLFLLASSEWHWPSQAFHWSGS